MIKLKVQSASGSRVVAFTKKRKKFLITASVYCELIKLAKRRKVSQNVLLKSVILCGLEQYYTRNLFIRERLNREEVFLNSVVHSVGGDSWKI